MEDFDKFDIHKSYMEFFDLETLKELNGIFEIISLENYTPSFPNIFKALQMDLKKNKVLLLGMDPYPQEGVATGLAFQVNLNSWENKLVNSSLKNIVKLLYKTYNGEVQNIEFIRDKITNNEFPLLPPNELFEKWQDEGVLLLNSALTTRIGVPGSHIKYWKNFIVKLIKFIDEKNPNLIWLLWGGKAQSFEKYIKYGKIIKHNHPAICGNLNNPKDFLNGSSFIETKHLISWI